MDESELIDYLIIVQWQVSRISALFMNVYFHVHSTFMLIQLIMKCYATNMKGIALFQINKSYTHAHLYYTK